MQFFEGVEQGLGIISAGVSVFDAQEVGFVFGVTAELLGGEGASDSSGVFEKNAGWSGEQCGVVDKAYEFFAGHGAGGVASGNMGDLVGHQGDELCFSVSGGDEGAVNVEESTRKSVGAGNVTGIEDFDGERHIGVGVEHDSLSQSVDVI